MPHYCLLGLEAQVPQLVSTDSEGHHFYQCGRKSQLSTHPPLTSSSPRPVGGLGSQQASWGRSLGSSFSFCCHAWGWATVFLCHLVEVELLFGIVQNFLFYKDTLFLVLWLEKAGFFWVFDFPLLFGVSCRQLFHFHV